MNEQSRRAHQIPTGDPTGLVARFNAVMLPMVTVAPVAIAGVAPDILIGCCIIGFLAALFVAPHGERVQGVSYDENALVFRWAFGGEHAVSWKSLGCVTLHSVRGGGKDLVFHVSIGRSEDRFSLMTPRPYGEVPEPQSILRSLAQFMPSITTVKRSRASFATIRSVVGWHVISGMFALALSAMSSTFQWAPPAIVLGIILSVIVIRLVARDFPAIRLAKGPGPMSLAMPRSYRPWANALMERNAPEIRSNEPPTGSGIAQ